MPPDLNKDPNNNPDDKVTKLEDLNQKLYSPSAVKFLQRKIEKPLSKISYDVSTAWNKAEEIYKKKKFSITSIFKVFFFFSLLALLISGSYAVYKLYGGANPFSPENIDILVTGDAFVSSGNILPLSISVLNKNSSSIDFANLTISYQKGEIDEERGTTEDSDRQKINLGNIMTGETKTSDITITLFGKQGTRKKIKIFLEYRSTGSSVAFVKESEYEVVITNAPLIISVDSSKQVNPNQEMSFNIKIVSNTDQISKNLVLAIDYPAGFIYKNSSPEPFSGDRVWFLGDLAPGASRTIAITGSFSGDFDEEKTFKLSVGEQDQDIQSQIGILYDAITYNIKLTKPFTDVVFLVGGQDKGSYALSSQNKITGEIHWANNLPTNVENLEIVAKLDGVALNKNSVVVNSGFYDSINNIIKWDSNSISAFSSVHPGAKGSVSFTFSSAPIHSPPFVDKPTVSIKAIISGSTIDNGARQPVTNSDRVKTIKFISNLQLFAKTLYYSGPITNTGPVPPKVGANTTYTIVWSITNSVNDVVKAEVRAKINFPNLVTWTGVFYPPDADIIYNNLTKEVIWKAGNISKGTGIDTDPKEISFQLQLNPSQNQIDTTPPLIDDSVLVGDDTFSEVVLRVVKNSLNIVLSKDPLAKSGDDRVIQ